MAENKNKKIKKAPFFKWKAEYCDYNLLAIIILLTCFGLIMLYSTSAYDAVKSHNGDDMYFFKNQLKNTGIALAALLGVAMIDYHYIKLVASATYVGSLILMILVKISPWAVEYNGSRRWLKIAGIQFQPSELAKIAIIIFLPLLMLKLGKNIQNNRGLLVMLMISGIQALAAWILTDNLSTAIIIFGISIVMIIIVQKKPKTLIKIISVVAVLGAIGVSIMGLTMETSDNFRIRRILAWLHPEANIEHEGFQVLQSLYAIGSGGFWGKGLGNSMQKLGFIPEAQNDMIFPIICEELGVFGAFLVLLMFGYLLYRLAFIARHAPDFYGTMMVSGIFAHIALQVIGNVFVAIRLMPTTGITLPFISYGGTSILMLMGEMGIAVSVSRGITFGTKSRKRTDGGKTGREDGKIVSGNK